MPPKLGNIRIAIRPLNHRPYPRNNLQPCLSQAIVKSTAYNIDLKSLSSSSSSSSSSSGQYGSSQGSEPASTPAEQQRRQDQAAQEAQGPNMDTLPHISEEAAAVGKAKGESGPDIEAQGTPVQEIIKGDSKAASKLPKVLKESLNEPSNTSKNQKRSYSTEAASNASFDDVNDGNFVPPDLSGLGLTSIENRNTPDMMQHEQNAQDPTLVDLPQLRFELPELPLPERMHLKRRDEPFLDQMTKLLMLHGKLSIAQRIMSMVQTHLRTLPPPRINPRRPLLPGSPPPSHLPLNPALYIELAIDSVAPLLRIRSQKGAAGGGMSLLIPIPIHRRRRRRTAINWVIDATNKKREMGVGHAPGFARRLAEEIVAIVEGRSAVWEKRNQVHRMGVQARINVGTKKKGKKGKT